MVIRFLAILALLAGGGMLTGKAAIAGPPGYEGFSYADAWMYWHAHGGPWHAPYRHTAFGRPVALVVPPIANRQTHYHWGVTGTTMTPIYHQYGRSFPPYAEAPFGLRNTPYWPSSTDQFGVYSIRGPW